MKGSNKSSLAAPGRDERALQGNVARGDNALVTFTSGQLCRDVGSTELQRYLQLLWVTAQCHLFSCTLLSPGHLNQQEKTRTVSLTA